jgi:two-component system response regulator QseB
MHILLVEDDLDLGADLQRALRNRGVTSEWLRSFSAARALDMTGHSFSAVVLDLGLGDGDGMDLLKLWRGKHLKLPVIVLTARDALPARLAGLDGGADDYLIKPVPTDELAARLRAVVRRAAGFSEELWRVGALEINTARRQVTLEGVLVDLPPREFQVLLELTRSAGKVVAKDRLAQALAPLGEGIEFNAIEVYIHHLRRKLGQHAIRTVRGVGYALESM